MRIGIAPRSPPLPISSPRLLLLPSSSDRWGPPVLRGVEIRPLRCPRRGTAPAVRCAGSSGPALRTCKNCKKQFDPSLNHPAACRFHTAHFGGETKRKFESVHTGGTMSTPDAGRVFQYWHCCGSEDPFDAGCTAAPHSSYDD